MTNFELKKLLPAKFKIYIQFRGHIGTIKIYCFNRIKGKILEYFGYDAVHVVIATSCTEILLKHNGIGL